jgi:hypothetical protein
MWDVGWVSKFAKARRDRTLFLSRLVGVDPDQATLDGIGREVQPRFLGNSKLKSSGVDFVPAG